MEIYLGNKGNKDKMEVNGKGNIDEISNISETR